MSAVVGFIVKTFPLAIVVVLPLRAPKSPTVVSLFTFILPEETSTFAVVFNASSLFRFRVPPLTVTFDELDIDPVIVNAPVVTVVSPV